jgi:aldose 1-epimerase
MSNSYVSLNPSAFETTVDGKPVALYEIKNASETLVAKITNYGGKMVQLLALDKEGVLGDVVLGWESIDETMANSPSAGAIIGRYANRIAGGRFTLDGRDYQLTLNDGRSRPNCLHGGSKGSRYVVFDAKQLNKSALELTYTFKDGEEGFPGNCRLKVTYTVTDNNELEIAYEAVTDKPTVVNFTQHNFWNLAGAGQGTIVDHELQINADEFTPVDANVVPTGELRKVNGTPFDFTVAKKIGQDIEQDDEQLRYCDGYDINFALRKGTGALSLAATIAESTSSRVMHVLTTEPGLQFFTGNGLPKDGSLRGKGQKVYPYRGAFCLETQHFPDSPNHPNFPPTTLMPGQRYKSLTIYRFATALWPFII